MKRQLCPRKKSLDPSILEVMLNRSWFFGISYFLFGFLALVLGADDVFIGKACADGQHDNCVGLYNRAILDNTKDIASIAVYVLLVIDLFVMIACFKWRRLASTQIYFILLTRILIVFIPTNASRGLHPFSHCCNSILAFLAHYCGSNMNIYVISIVNIFEMSFGYYFAYDRQFGLQEGLLCTLYTIITIIIMVSLSAAFEHFSYLHVHIAFMNGENNKLHNGMHEGLLILSKPQNANGDGEEIFSNKSA